ncbi:MAG TPA: tetraacyldisaccharide 4'-kinase, partial [Bryobacteraceae bacterium]|nr:tetraacyldisaccharide 4'-kinase [Bryobacteraceae bacterium]
PALLTRGYGRNTQGMLILKRGNERVPTDLTGDEAQLYLRRAKVPMGIGSDRFEVGQELLKALTPGIIFMDDGFQHLQLKRDFDLVLVDSLNPFGGGHLIPLGRLREPLEGLARAHAFLITRANESVNTEAIEHVLHKHNPTAPVFRGRTVPLRWTNQKGDQLAPDGPAVARAVAFCGLGNPAAFWNTLEQYGIRPLEHYDYGDHHRYTPVELRRLARRTMDIGADTLLTTEKDAVNLCPDVAGIIEPLNLWWLEIGMDIDRRDELIALIRQTL